MFQKLFDLLGSLKRVFFRSKAPKPQEPVAFEDAESRAEKLLEEVRRCEESLQKTAEQIAEETQKILKQLQLQQEALPAREESPGGEGDVPQAPPAEDGKPEEEPPEDTTPSVAEEEEAPVPAPREDGTDVIIGLDFGTSRCKVVMRTPYLPGSYAYPVVFDIKEECPLLLPAEVYRGPGGEFSLKKAEGYELIRGLKVNLMDNPGEGDSKVNVVGYLALVLKYARGWFKREHYEGLGHFRIFWSVNLGLPSSGSKDKEMRDDFQEVLEAAWKLSISEKAYTVEAARAVLVESGIESEYKTELSLREEVVAEVQGYCRSYMKQLGLHVMVDAGASTLDICGFTLFKSSDNTPGQALLVPVVERLGVLHLRGATDETGKVEPEFARSCVVTLFRVLKALITGKDPNAPAFKRGEQLRVFLCGGGGLDPFYARVVKKVEGLLKERMISFGGFLIQPIPKHEDVQWPADIDEEHYHRIAVAFGLSFSEDDVGDIIPPDSMDDIDPPEVEPGGDPIGKEQV